MKDFRMDRNTKEHYTSFEEVGVAWGCRPVVKKTSDAKKLKSQQEKFVSKHKCRACGQPMTYIKGTSVMSCKNVSCKGVRQKRTDQDGNEVVTYLPSYDLLDELGAQIADVIF